MEFTLRLLAFCTFSVAGEDFVIDSSMSQASSWETPETQSLESWRHFNFLNIRGHWLSHADSVFAFKGSELHLASIQLLNESHDSSL